jgi:thiamine biosynthesis lipoprotein
MHLVKSTKRRIAIALLLAILLLIFTASCARREMRGFTLYGSFDTVTTVTVYGTEKEAERLSFRVSELLSHYNRLFDIYHDYPGTSNLKTLNDMAGIAPVSLDPEILSLLTYGLEIDALTDGKCRITYGAVLEIWHDYRTAGEAIPPEALLRDAAEHTSPDLLVLDVDAGTAYLTDAEASVDVGAIAKGYAVEAITRTLIAEGFSDFSLNVGGNLRLVGDTSRTVGIRNPLDSSVLLDFEMSSGSLVTSGNYERFYTVNGVRYHHLIDPETAMPASLWASVSVLTEDSALADALSTALFMLDYDSAIALIERIGGVEALWVNADGEIFKTAGFPID